MGSAGSHIVTARDETQGMPWQAAEYVPYYGSDVKAVRGMLGAAARVPAPYQLTDLGYDVALKTGTPQKNNTEYHSAAIAFAPADDADIAISVMLELGDNANYIIRQVLDAYYGTDTPAEPTGSSASEG